MRLPLTLSLHVPDFDLRGVEPDGLLEKLVEIATIAIGGEAQALLDAGIERLTLAPLVGSPR
jgi:hypothetical protein